MTDDVPAGAGDDIFGRLAEMTARGEAGVLATVIRTARSVPRHAGSRMIIHPDGTVTGSTGGGAAEARVIAAAAEVLATGTCRILKLDLAGEFGVCGGELEIFLEPVLKTTPFWVIGAGHVGRAVVQVGAALPFGFVLVDDRPEYLQAVPPAPGVRTLLAGPGELGALIEVSGSAAVLVASRSHDLDGDYLAALFAAEAAAGRRFGFLGGLGSRRKAAVLAARFAADPVAAGRFAGIQLPVGLDLGAETPAEIALSVLAEAMAVLRGTGLLTDDKGVPLGVALHRRRL